LTLTEIPKNICADEKRLRQVLINLLSNAIKFTDRGLVTLKVEAIEDKKSPHSEPASQNLQSKIPNRKSKIKNRLVRFQVEDTGCGIHPEHLEKIFLPFEQVGDISRQTEGTGLGLAITQKLISLMGSEIFVESNPGVGSKFWFDLDLPAVSDLTDAISVKSMNTAIGYQGKKQKILVVDDRWENRSTLVNLLEPIGFELTEAADGEEGLEKAVEFQPDLILSDLVMPRMDGFGLIRQLRQLPEFQSTIIIAVSASVFNADRQNCLDSGYSDFLAKPIQAENLLDKIQSYLNLSWIYERQETEQNLAAALALASSLQEMAIPPRAELLTLYQAAQGGDVEVVELEVMRLKQLNSEYTSFAAKVLEMSNDFECDMTLG
jgi:CheY-like chemotaxis protein